MSKSKTIMKWLFGNHFEANYKVGAKLNLKSVEEKEYEFRGDIGIIFTILERLDKLENKKK